MHLDALLWLFLPVFVAGGSALLSFYIMQAKLEVAVSKERETLAEAQATITSQKVMMEERIRATEESVKRAALDEFLKDFRVEERSYVRETKSLDEAKRSMIMQERLFFRNIPLSDWVEHEMVVEIGSDLKRLQEQVSVFGGASLSAGSQVGLPTGLSTGLSAGFSANDGRLPISKLLDNTTVARPAGQTRSNSLVPAHAGFGAQ
jgi:hypothetical protein